jgi:hypothetical protein
MTGRDVVAGILAVGVVGIVLLLVWGIVSGTYAPSGDGLVGGLLGALLAVLARYVTDTRQTP